MRKRWKKVVAFGCAGMLLLTGCGLGSADGSAESTISGSMTSNSAANGDEASKDTSAAESIAAQKSTVAGSNAEKGAANEEATAVKIGLPAGKTDPDSPDKEETVHVKADADGTVSEVTVDNVLHVYGTEEVADVSELTNIHNTEGDEAFDQNGTDLSWENLGQDIKYSGTSDSDSPVSVSVTYWLDGEQVSPEELAGATGHVRMRFDYENTTSMTVTVHDKSYDVKVPFIAMTAMILPEDTFANIEVTNGRCMNLEDQNMVLGYAMPGLADSMRLTDFEPTEEIELPSYMEVECDAEEFELSFTATIVTNGLFKDMKDDDLDDIDELTDNMKELGDATKEMVDGAAQLLEGTEALESGLGEYVSAVSQVNSGMSQLTDGIAQLSDNKSMLYEGSAALSEGLDKINAALPDSLTVAGITGDQKLEELLTTLAEDAKVLADAMVTLKGEQEWEQVFEKAQAYVNLVETSYKGALTELSLAEAESATLTSDIADTISASADTIGDNAGSTATSAANEALSEIAASIDLSDAGLTVEQEAAVRDRIASDLAGLDITETVSGTVASEAYSEIESTIVSVEEQRMQHVTAAKQYLMAITAAATPDQETMAKLDTEEIQKAAEDMKKQFLALTEYTDDMEKLTTGVADIQKMYSELKGGIDQLATGSGQLTDGISQFNSGIDALYSGAVLLQQGTATLESYGDPLLEGASALTEGMSALHEGIQTFDEEAISELTDLAGDDLLNLSSRIRAIKIADTSYQTFSGLAPGRKGTVRFIIETEEISKD